MDKSDVITSFEPMQIELAGVLAEISEEAADIYVGAISVHTNLWISDRIALCAHGIRELMNKLPVYVEVPIIQGDRQRLGDFANELVKEWKLMKDGNGWCEGWEGEISPPLRKVLMKTEKLVNSELERLEARDQQARELIQKFNYHPIPLPGDVENAKIREWNKLRTEFAGI